MAEQSPLKRRYALPAENSELRVAMLGNIGLTYEGQSPEVSATAAEITRLLAECAEKIRAIVRKNVNHEEGQLVAGLQNMTSALPCFLTSIAAHDLVVPRNPLPPPK